jgi:hypothetical protein
VKDSNPSQRWGRPEELIGTAVFCPQKPLIISTDRLFTSTAAGWRYCNHFANHQPPCVNLFWNRDHDR